VKLKKGTKFLHSRYLDVGKLPEKVQLTCVITAVRMGVVYYRPVYGTHDDGTPWLGSPAYFPKEQAERWMLPM
jgi:hypothetical protein